MKRQPRSAQLLLSIGMACAMTIGALAAGRTVYAAGPVTVGLGNASGYAVLAGTPGITNTGSTVITGDIGIDPAASVTGFPPGTVNGTIHSADADALAAKTDLVTAYNNAAGRTPVTAVAGGLLGGKTLVAGVYNAGGVTLNLTGTVTLDAQNDPNAVWVFQATSDLITASSSHVAYINGAQPCNVFWQVTSSATLGSDSTFVGTILALTSITVNSSVVLSGRALARNGAVTLINDVISTPVCVVVPTAAPRAATSSGRQTLPPTDVASTPVSVPGPSALLIGSTLMLLIPCAILLVMGRRRLWEALRDR